MTPVRPELLKTIQVPYQLTPNAVRPANAVKTVLQEVRLIPVLILGLPSAEAAMLVPIPAAQVKNPYLALGMKIKLTFIQPNVEQVVMNADITQIALQRKNLVPMAALLLIPAAYAQAATQNHQYPAKNITHGKADE